MTKKSSRATVLAILFTLIATVAMANGPAARGESPAAFGRRCIPAGCVAPRSNIPDIFARRALPAGRITGLGATPDFHHGLLEGNHHRLTRHGVYPQPLMIAPAAVGCNALIR